MKKQDPSHGKSSLLADRHTQEFRPESAQQTMQLCWVLTDTSQQQLYPEQNTEDNSKNHARAFQRPSTATPESCCHNLIPAL